MFLFGHAWKMPVLDTFWIEWQVVRVIWRKGSIAAACERLLNYIHQVAPVCTPPNACFHGPTRVHDPNGSHSAIFAQLTTEYPYTSQRTAPPTSKLPFPMGDLDPHLIYGSLGPPKFSTQMASRSVKPFFAGLTTVTDWQTDHATSL